MSLSILDIEKPVAEIDQNIAELRRLSEAEGVDRSMDILELERMRDELISDIFSNLSAWDKTLLARHPNRPYTFDYIRAIFEDFTELHGDRLYGDDKAVVGGFATLMGEHVLVVGHQKGRDLKDRQYRNFGSAKPEGFRKATRLMKLAEKCGRPIVCLVDTPAADCSFGAEERGISEAIARAMFDMSVLRVPVVVVVIGEGGSGGALGLAVGNRILMQEHAIYSVIPPEGCAAILWRDPTKAAEAANAMKITAKDALDFGLIDEIVKEPLGGAHRNHEAAGVFVREAIVKSLRMLDGMSPDELAAHRYGKFRSMGKYSCVESGMVERA